MKETQETQGGSLGWKDTLEEEMATHSSILAWKIPGTEEPGGLPSMGSQRVGHNLATKHTHTCMYIGTSPVAQRLGVCLPVRRTWVQSLVRELRSYMPQSC